MDKKIIAYDIVSSNKYEYLCESVNKKIAEGWQPYGCPFADDDYITQAIVKYEGDK